MSAEIWLMAQSRSTLGGESLCPRSCENGRKPLAVLPRWSVFNGLTVASLTELFSQIVAVV